MQLELGLNVRRKINVFRLRLNRARELQHKVIRTARSRNKSSNMNLTQASESIVDPNPHWAVFNVDSIFAYGSKLFECCANSDTAPHRLWSSNWNSLTVPRCRLSMYGCPARQSGTRCQMNLKMRTAWIVLNSSWKPYSLATTSVTSTLEAIFNEMLYLRTYLPASHFLHGLHTIRHISSKVKQSKT